MILVSIVTVNENIMHTKLASYLSDFEPSSTLSISEKAKALKSQGHPVINLSLGQPDFDTPDHIKKAALQAIHDGKTQYTAISGIDSLKTAIQQKMEQDTGIHYPCEQIMVCSGAKQAICNALFALLNPGDQVLIPTPFWVSYPNMVKLARGQPKIIQTSPSDRYQITSQLLNESISSATKLLLLNSPNNPSGIVYTPKTLEVIAETLKSHPNIMILSDEIYADITWPQTTLAQILNIAPELKDQVIVVNGVSKAYAMTGWRIGYAVGPKPLIQAMNKIQSQSTGCPNAIAQYAAAEAISGDQSPTKNMTQSYYQRYQMMLEELKNIPLLKALKTDGTFYLMIDASLAIKKLSLDDDIRFAKVLLDKCHIAAVPGSAFGMQGMIRLSIASNKQQLKEACQRMRQWLDLGA
jgi:aspartate aminotransferase